MIISDLGYLEVVSEGSSIVGGLRFRTNETKVKQKATITIEGGISSATISQNSSVVTSNDQL